VTTLRLLGHFSEFGFRNLFPRVEAGGRLVRPPNYSPNLPCVFHKSTTIRPQQPRLAHLDEGCFSNTRNAYKRRGICGRTTVFLQHPWSPFSLSLPPTSAMCRLRQSVNRFTPMASNHVFSTLDYKTLMNATIFTVMWVGLPCRIILAAEADLEHLEAR
jgi:hypothetical protein